MKKLLLILSTLSVFCFSSIQAHGRNGGGCNPNLYHPKDQTKDIPVIEATEVTNENFTKVVDVAQYGGADWSQVIGISHNVSLKEAFDIASSNESVTYFFYMKGRSMVLVSGVETYRAFERGDAVFFTGTPCWGSAPGYSDGYIKN